jgi:Ca-activated chloride channel family protein
MYQPRSRRTAGPTARKENEMKRKTKIRGWFGAALLLMLAVQTPATPAKSVELDVQMSQPIVLAGSPQKAYLRVALTGLESDRGRRAPVNVAIVLDRSGSMSGQKIEEAKRAAIMAVEQLRDDDIVSVVTYQSTVDVLVPRAGTPPCSPASARARRSCASFST